ncbi:MAG TPA: MlaD family protein [Burkholderiaceae bacterium]
MTPSPPDGTGDPRPGAPLVQRRHGISLVWILPIVAALIGAVLLFRNLSSEGPRLRITFLTAAGLEAGKTPVKYKDVTVGTVRAVELSEDRSHIVVTLTLVKSAASLANAGTRFWVVRPRIGVGGVSGVDTLLSGAYIGVDTGASHEERKDFTGLEEPPPVINGMAGKTFVLRAADLGSLDIGSPVYYRRIRVGQVASYRLDDSGRTVNLQIFVEAPYDRFVTGDTRFWNASGVDVSLGADGLKLNTQSIATIVAGGIAFGAPDGSPPSTTPARSQYRLAAGERAALAPPDGPAQRIELRFDQSLRGLSIGAPVEFLGVNFGSVTSVALDYDPAKRRFSVIVGADVFVARLGSVVQRLPLDGDHKGVQFGRSLVAQGLRAQARSGNLLTGQRYISLDFVPNAPKVAMDASDANDQTLRIPTVNGDFDQLQEKFAHILDKVDKIPLESIARHLDADLARLGTTLDGANKTFDSVNRQLLPQARQTLQQAGRTLNGVGAPFADDSPLQQNLGQTLEEVQRAARSVRELTDLLGRNPEALLRGRPADAVAPPAVPPAPTAPSPEIKK